MRECSLLNAEVQVDIWIVAIAGVPLVIDREESAGAVAPVDQVVPIRDVLREDRHVAGAEHSLALILHQHRLALQHNHELVRAFVPVTLTRPGARLEDDMADSDLRQSASLADPPEPAIGDLPGIRLRIAGAVGLLDAVHVDLGHEISFRHPSASWGLSEVVPGFQLSLE